MFHRLLPLIPWAFLILIYLQKPENVKSEVRMRDSWIRVLEFLTTASCSGMTIFSLIRFTATLSVGYVFTSNLAMMALFMISCIKYPMMIQEVPRHYPILSVIGCLSVVSLYVYLVSCISVQTIQPFTGELAFLPTSKVITETPMSEMILDEYHPAAGHFGLPMNQSNFGGMRASVLMGGRELQYVQKIESHYKIKLGKTLLL
jgi:hypothetical protein